MIVVTENDLDNLLSLITASILADKRVFDCELDVFIKSTSQLNLECDFEFSEPARLQVNSEFKIRASKQSNTVNDLQAKISEPELLKWYELNKDIIRNKIASPFFKDWFYELLDQLADLPNKGAITGIMREISQADGELHISERALITLAEQHWGMR